MSVYVIDCTIIFAWLVNELLAQTLSDKARAVIGQKDRGIFIRGIKTPALGSCFARSGTKRKRRERFAASISPRCKVISPGFSTILSGYYLIDLQY